jgi:hypothetical protein
MKTVIELLELLRSLYYILTKCEIELAAKDTEQAEKTVKEIDGVIAELESPRWYTPEQWEKRTGEAWPEKAAVYALEKGHTFLIFPYEVIVGFEAMSYGAAKRKGLDKIICATEAGPPPDDWRPEEDNR